MTPPAFMAGGSTGSPRRRERSLADHPAAVAWSICLHVSPSVDCVARQHAMPTTPGPRDAGSLPTRYSLLARLQDWGDEASWQEFFDTYRRLIFNVAVRAGLTEPEAQDVVQDTVVTVAKNLKHFKTDPSHGSFKAWLLKTTRWRIINQFKKRRPDQVARAHRAHDDTRQTATLDRMPGPDGGDLDSLWDAEWRDHLVEAALQRLKRRVKPKHFQLFFLHTIKGQSVLDVAKSMGVSAAQVYLVKHRLARQFKRETELLLQEME